MQQYATTKWVAWGTNKNHVCCIFSKLLGLTPCFSKPGCRNLAHLQFMKILKFSDEIWPVHNHQPSSWCRSIKVRCWKAATTIKEHALSRSHGLHTLLIHCSIIKPSYSHLMGCKESCCQMLPCSNENHRMPLASIFQGLTGLQPPYHKTITWTLSGLHSRFVIEFIAGAF